MKEETISKKLPPKLSGTTSAPKMPSDEILNALLKINNFDSISRESLDIDLSACVTISGDPTAIMNGNSLSSTDFWRVLDENAQTSQLDILSGSEDSSTVSRGITLDDTDATVSKPATSNGIKSTQHNTFSGTFLRPDPPPTATSLFSPLKKCSKTFEQQQRKMKVPLFASLTESEKLKTSLVMRSIKIEATEQPTVAPTANAKVNGGNNSSGGSHISNSNNNNSNKPKSTNSFCEVRAYAQPTDMNISSAIKTLARAGNKSSIGGGSVVGEKQQQLTEKAPVQLYKCLDCEGLLLQGEQELNAHELASHRILRKCNFCEREFEQDSGLKKHLKAHRPAETRKDAWKKCPDCGKCLKLGSMWMHRKIHSDNKKYGCDICGQKFVQKINLTHHTRVHTVEKPYECPECQKRFQERSHLQRHQKYHAQTRSYRCDKCGKMYKTERCLKVHNLVHLEQRPFACNVCEKSFISNSKLKQHSNIHTGERPFKCNYCPRDFTNFPNWLKHTRRRHKVDHKTGEHLENIPSYCSKKSAKTPKVPKTVDNGTINPTKSGATGSEPEQSLNTKVTKEAQVETITKTQTKRKKKTNAPVNETNLPNLTVTVVATDCATAKTTAGIALAATSTSGIYTSVGTKSVTTPTPKMLTASATKIKRERKQLTPKQVQKQTAPPTIKKELLDTKVNVTNGFPDLHCLSITSAEELIMEQALEMEECGLYDVPNSTTNTDNAISSEAAAALHFKIKNEFSTETNIKQEDYSISLKDLTKNRVLCSSLESSPFSSPASIDFSTTTSTMNVSSGNLASDLHMPANTYYIPSSFTISSQGALITSTTTNDNKTVVTAHDSMAQQLSSATTPVTQQQHPQIQTQTLFSNLYLPMTVGMPLLVRPNQMLPSVDTLFFSAHANASNLFHSKPVMTTPAATELSSTSTLRKLT